jgi:tetratricopeptide (TPR) repeat protein
MTRYAVSGQASAGEPDMASQAVDGRSIFCYRGGLFMPPLQLVFSLRQPERAEWTRDPDFSARIHQRLLTERERILASTAADDQRPHVETVLLRLIGRPMSTRQRMLLYYLLALCAQARDLERTAHFYQALEWCSRVEELAGVAQDYGALVDIHELRGTLHRAISLYRGAAEEFSLALRVLREHTEDRASFDPEFEATLAGKAAVMDYFAGQYSRALEHLRQAGTTLPLAKMSVTGQGTYAWTLALLHRQRNEPREALFHAEMAAARYRELGATNSTCRILALAAEICLDVAESPVSGDRAARGAYLERAARYAEEALAVGRAASDTPGVELSGLALARLDRLRDPEGAVDTAVRIRTTIRLARRIRDNSLLTAAQTALGEDLLGRGKKAAGERWLEQAVETARRIHAPGLAYRAQRRLRQAEGRVV